MLKKLLRLIRNLIIGTIWSYLYLLIANTVLIHFWNFSTLSHNSWRLLKIFWERGGTIKTGRDYLLLFCLALLIPLWLWGWRKLVKIRYLNFLLAPIRMYNDRIIRKYGASSKRIVLKNLGRSKKVEEEIDSKAQPQSQVKTDEEVNKIRGAVLEKINSAQNTKK